MPVAVKVITHSSKDDDRIGRELALSLSFDHPNLVRALHFTKIRINNATPTNVSTGCSGSVELHSAHHSQLYLASIVNTYGAKPIHHRSHA